MSQFVIIDLNPAKYIWIPDLRNPFEHITAR